jgi:NAD(P)-dependent dehydrogenase (short-subunit alcohol dehydrogenase family)
MVRTIISLGGTMTDSYPFTVFSGEFKGKRVLVTGGTKGIGEAIARRFALGGASVAITARSEAANGQDSALFIKADIGMARGVQNVVGRIQREWGGLDILVNNVGGTETKAGGFEVLSDEDWQRIMEVNLLAAELHVSVPQPEKPLIPEREDIRRLGGGRGDDDSIGSPDVCWLQPEWPKRFWTSG